MATNRAPLVLATLLSALHAVSAPAASGNRAGGPPGTDIAVLRVASHAVAARVEIGGHPAWMLVDTGATRSRVDARLAARLALRATARYRLGGLDGAEHDALCHGPIPIVAGGLELVVDCLSWSSELPVPLRLDGVLGADALASADVLLDTAAPRLRLAPAGTLASWVDGAAVPAVRLEGRPAVATRWRDGAAEASGYWVLDSGADAPILFGELVPGGTHEGTARPRTAVQTSGGLLDARTTRLRWLEVGSRRLPWLETVLLPHVRDRAELGLLPPSLLGPMLLSLRDGIVVGGARLRGSPRGDRVLLAAASGAPSRVHPVRAEAAEPERRLIARDPKGAENTTTPTGGARSRPQPLS
jgi:hypothetical protein